MSSDHDTKRQATTTVTTTTETQTEQALAGSELNVLSPQEEKVLRMLHGMSEEDAHQLKFALGASEESRLNLARLEHYLLQMFTSETVDSSVLEEFRSLRDAITGD